MKSKIYRVILVLLFSIHTYLLFPGIVILYIMISSRGSPYSPKNEIIYFWDSILFMALSYVVLFILVRLAFYFPKNKWKRIVSVLLYLFVFMFVYINWWYFYSFNTWTENTFTTEMKVYWGPFDDAWQKPEPDKLEYIGALKIGTYYTTYYERLSNVFSNFDTDDWVFTTIGMFNRQSHWESHPVFIFCNEENIKRLENFDRNKLNFLFNKEITNNTTENIFNGNDSLNSKFMSYIMGDSTDNENAILNDIYFEIDSLINNKSK